MAVLLKHREILREFFLAIRVLKTAIAAPPCLIGFRQVITVEGTIS